MTEQQIDIQLILKYLRETIALQSQEIAVLKATIESLQEQQTITATEDSLKE